MEKKAIKQFLMDTLNGMAIGLFATLIIGTIINTIGSFFPVDVEGSFAKFMHDFLTGGATCLQLLTGAGIGVGIALAMKFGPLHTVVLAASGELAAYLSLSTKFVSDGVDNMGRMQVGDPLTIYLVVISVALLIKLVFTRKTPVDLLIIPLFGVSAALVTSLLLRYPAIYVTYGIQWLVNEGTNATPFFMGIIVAVLMGMALTAPISSAAIAAMIFVLPAGMTIPQALADPAYSGLVIASGAAVVGCSTQMVGFAVQSRKDNSIGTILSIGIGTSMLQFKNIIKKPIIWLPTIIVSAILGPIATCLAKVACIGSSAGMGTAGFVGQIGTYASMGNSWETLLAVLGLEIIAPAVATFAIDLLFRKLGWIKPGDLKI